MSDELLRSLERAWLESGDPRDKFAWLTHLVRSGRATREQAREQRLLFYGRSERGPSRFEKFISWDDLWGMTHESRLRPGWPPVLETIDDVISEWVTDYPVYELVQEFERDQDVELTDEQRDQVRDLIEQALMDGAYRAIISDLTRVVTRVAELVEDAAGTDGLCSQMFEERRLPTPPRLRDRRGRARAIVRHWVGAGPGGEPGVWFRLSRTFLRAYAEAVAYMGYACDEGLTLAGMDGGSVVRTAIRWGDAVGEAVAPRQWSDWMNYVDWPTNRQINKELGL